MEDIEARSEALIRSPVGCAFLQLVEKRGMTPSVAADPGVSLYTAARAVNNVTPWQNDHDAICAAVLADGPRLLPLARAILGQPAAQWWWGPLDRERQLWVSDGEPSWLTDDERPTEEPVPRSSEIPTRAPSDWERYAQKPKWRLDTYTIIDWASSILMMGGDLILIDPPYTCYRMPVSRAARVYEIDSPESWRQLCLRYPASGQNFVMRPTYPPPRPGYLVPDFVAVARDWDAVHLTLGGLLTATQVTIADSERVTELSGWDGERTAWLRWMFDGVERLPDIREQPNYDWVLHMEWGKAAGEPEGWRSLSTPWFDDNSML